MTTATTILHAVIDPLCGWCYGAEPLLEAAAALPGIELVLHGGGMLTGARRQPIDAGWRSMVLDADERIARTSGQSFGADYRDGLLNDTSVVLDSGPPTTALLAVRELGGDGREMLAAVQRAHYVDGRSASDLEVLVSVAVGLGHDEDAFREAFAACEGTTTEDHIRASRAVLARAGGQGFPTMAIERADGSLDIVPHADCYGRPAAWADRVASVVRARP